MITCTSYNKTCGINVMYDLAGRMLAYGMYNCREEDFGGN